MVYFGVFFVLPNSVQFPYFYATIPDFTPLSSLHIFSSIFHPLPSYMGGRHVLHNQGGGWDVRLGKKRNMFLRVVAKLFWRAIYCTNPIS